MRRRAHCGQALLVMIALLACLVGGSLLVFTTGQLVNDKLRLQNAADAAAYSAAQWEARSLNFQAYVNRAMVANEVAIAQFVSLRSWSAYLRSTLGNSAQVTRWVPYVGPVLTALSRTWRGVDQTLQTTLPLAEAAISHWNVDLLSNAQVVMHQQALIGAAELVADVAHDTEPRAHVAPTTRVFQAQNAAGWQNGLTTRYRHGSGELTRYRELLMAARDGFSSTRRADLLPGNPFVALSKRGGTDLIGEYAWRGMDTLATHFDYVFGSTELPVGWASAENQRLRQAGRGLHGSSWRDNPRSSRLAERAVLLRQGYAGIAEIRDVVQSRRQQDLRLDYSVHLQLPRGELATADRVVTPVGLGQVDGSMLDLSAPLAGEGLQALATAQVYFRRPVDRNDGRREWPSLFNPYWQAQLVATPVTTRTLAAVGLGIGIDPYAALP